MNNQPKFKKGDRVRDIKQAITGEIVKFSDFYKEWIILTSSGRKTTSNEKDLQPLPSTAPDMLAIPDDHVFEVEWKLLQPETKDAYIVCNKTQVQRSFTCPHFDASKLGYTHYLTEADLLKLPFQK